MSITWLIINTKTVMQHNTNNCTTTEIHCNRKTLAVVIAICLSTDHDLDAVVTFSTLTLINNVQAVQIITSQRKYIRK